MLSARSPALDAEVTGDSPPAGPTRKPSPQTWDNLRVADPTQVRYRAGIAQPESHPSLEAAAGAEPLGDEAQAAAQHIVCLLDDVPHADEHVFFTLPMVLEDRPV